MCKGESNKPKLTLVGKGVCFDSGGLDLKSSGFCKAHFCTGAMSGMVVLRLVSRDDLLLCLLQRVQLTRCDGSQNGFGGASVVRGTQ